MEKNNQNPQHLYLGEVVSDKMAKTILVKVMKIFEDDRYHKIVRTIKKYAVHDEEGQAKKGDFVEFYEGRPLSKTKYMYLARVVGSAVKRGLDDRG